MIEECAHSEDSLSRVTHIRDIRKKPELSPFTQLVYLCLDCGKHIKVYPNGLKEEYSFREI